jgi:cell division protein FtsB
MIGFVIKLFGGRLGAGIAAGLAGLLVTSLATQVWGNVSDWWETRKLNKQIEALQEHVKVLGLNNITLKQSNSAQAIVISEFEAAMAQEQATSAAVEAHNALLTNQVAEKERMIGMIQDDHRRELERAYARNFEWAAVRWPDDVVDSMCDYYRAIGVLGESGTCEGPSVPPSEVPGIAPDRSPSIPLDVNGGDGTAGQRLTSLQYHDYRDSQRTQSGHSSYGVQ